MIYFQENNVDKKIIQKQISNYLDIITNLNNTLTQKRELFLICLDKISTSIDNLTDVKDTEILFKMLDNVKLSFSIINQNLETIKILKNKLSKINETIFLQFYINPNTLSTLKSFNTELSSFQNTIFDDIMKTDKFLQEYLDGCSFIFTDSTLKSNIPESTSQNIPETPDVSSNDNTEFPDWVKTSDSSIQEPNKISDNQSIDENQDLFSSQSLPSNSIDLSNINSLASKKISDISKEIDIPVEELNFKINIPDNNVLLISEKENKVYLPYKIKDLNEELSHNKRKYSNLQDLINKKYIIPLSRYKSPVISRFREAYNLMKHKENVSVAECLDLAFELSFKRLLNPAVITACKNLDELDSYLDCLESKQLSNFGVFEVKYDISPLVKKH